MAQNTYFWRVLFILNDVRILRILVVIIMAVDNAAQVKCGIGAEYERYCHAILF
jgi:hypothetical protein